LRLWICTDLEEAENFSLSESHAIDLIICDFTKLGVDDPKTAFLKLQSKLQDIPIIVIADQTDHDFMAFAVKAGAADSIAHGQIENDPDGLIGMIKACLTMHDIHKKKNHMRIRTYWKVKKDTKVECELDSKEENSPTRFMKLISAV
jgi:PleD family two-component response regulator